jgi:hypothetical protein
MTNAALVKLNFMVFLAERMCRMCRPLHRQMAKAGSVGLMVFRRKPHLLLASLILLIYLALVELASHLDLSGKVQFRGSLAAAHLLRPTPVKQLATVVF